MHYLVPPPLLSKTNPLTITEKKILPPRPCQKSLCIQIIVSNCHSGSVVHSCPTGSPANSPPRGTPSPFARHVAKATLSRPARRHPIKPPTYTRPPPRPNITPLHSHISLTPHVYHISFLSLSPKHNQPLAVWLIPQHCQCRLLPGS